MGLLLIGGKDLELRKNNFLTSLIKSFNSKSAYLLIGWPVYFLLFFITERIPEKDCHIIHCALDDMIPFNEYFAVFYFLWYALVFGSLLFFFVYDLKNFEKLQKFIMVTQAIAITIYIIYPSIQIGRPDIVGNNIFCDAMRFIYNVDTPTGVCPSLHVAYSLGLASVWAKRKKTPAAWKGFIIGSSIMICFAVVFVKQHSVIDVAAALAVSMIAESIIFTKWHKAMLRLNKIKIKKITYKLSQKS